MNKYFIPEIDLKVIKNHPEIFDKLKKDYNMVIEDEQIIITIDGFYKIQDNKLIKYKIINRDSSITENFIKNMTLIGTNYYHKKIEEVYNIPYEHSFIWRQIIKFSVGKGNNYLVLERINNKINNLYFLSKKKINEDDRFFLKDVSSFVETLNV